MRDAVSDIGRKALAILVLLAAAYVLLHIVIGVVMAVAWVVVAVLAVMAIIWALRVL
jgi:hypothetical protein